MEKMVPEAARDSKGQVDKIQPWKAFVKTPVLKPGQHFNSAAIERNDPIRLIVTCSAKTDLGG